MAARSESFLIAIRRANSIVPTPIAGTQSHASLYAGSGLPVPSAGLSLSKQHQHRDHIGVQELSDVGSSLLTPEQVGSLCLCTSCVSFYCSSIMQVVSYIYYCLLILYTSF